MEAADATDARPEPTRRLPPQARTLWRLEAAIRWGIAAFGVAGLLNAVGDELPALLTTAAWILLPLGAVVDVLVLPEIRFRRWRYAVREEEIDLRRGTFTITRTLVPMARVQHVDTRQGVLEQSLGVSAVIFHTAAGASVIPALRKREAIEVRDRIADLARTPETL